MALFSKKKKFNRGGYVGTPMVGTPIPIPLVNPGEIVIHRDGTAMIVNEDRTCSPIEVDREAHTRLAEFLCYMDEGETITEHEHDCPLDDCKMRDQYTEDAQRIIRFLTTGEHA